jgi:hypothetical protein
MFGKALDYDQLSPLENWNVWRVASGVTERFLYSTKDNAYIPPVNGVYPWPIPADGSLKDKNLNSVEGYSKGHVAW